ncbi:hypothetical protein BDR22DRAFT_343835 [Usnea florida]
MFRHSEIYSILRERQVRKENSEADGGDQPETVASQPEGAEATTLPDEEQGVQTGPEAKEVFTTASETTPQHLEATHLAGKRKRGDSDTGHVPGSRKYASRSTRGFVRELDSIAAEDQTLDYGEESSIAEEVKQNEFAVPQAQEKDCQSQVRPSEGRKIWWPTLKAPSI